MAILSLFKKAAIVGSKWGRFRVFRKKTLEGFLAFVVFSCASVLGMSLFVKFSFMEALAMMLVGALFEVAFESVDNLVIPVLLSLVFKNGGAF